MAQLTLSQVFALENAMAEEFKMNALLHGINLENKKDDPPGVSFEEGFKALREKYR